jgi:TolB protein
MSKKRRFSVSTVLIAFVLIAGAAAGVTFGFGTLTFAATASVDAKANGSDGPVIVTPGSIATVTWTSSNVTSCSLVIKANGAIVGGGNTSTSGSTVTPAITKTFVYTFTCKGATTVKDSVTIQPGTPPLPAATVNVKANGSDGPVTILSGSTASLSWTSTNATTCSNVLKDANGTQIGGGTVPTSSTGTSTPAITQQVTYTYTCTGAGGSGSDSVTVSPQVVQPPSTKISFSARPNGVDHIYLMNVDGTGITQLTSGSANDVTPQWSKDGTKLTFERDGADGPTVFTMNADGSNVLRLSPSPARDVLPGWSPDGAQIIFTYIVTPPVNPGDLAITDIMAMNADGTNRHSIFAHTTDLPFNMEPRWSPDGTKIVFMCGKAGVGVQICTVNADGSGLTKLTNTSGLVNGDPHWSYDGTKIAFGSNREGGGKLNLFTMNADGSNVQQLTHVLPPYEAGDAGWSQDGAQMTFEWDVSGQMQSDPNAHAEVWIVNTDGTNAHTTGVTCSGVGCGPSYQPQ